MHELLHAALQHGLRRREREPKLWNIAADIVVNGMVRKDTSYFLPEGGVEVPALAHLSVEEVYEQLQSGRVKVPRRREAFPFRSGTSVKPPAPGEWTSLDSGA